MDSFAAFLGDLERDLGKAVKSMEGAVGRRTPILRARSAFGKDAREAKRLHDSWSDRAAKQAEIDLEEVAKTIHKEIRRGA